MNKAAFLHIPDSRYCFAISDTELVIRLRVAKEDKDLAISLVYGDKYSYQDRQEESPMTLAFVDHLHAYFEARLQLSDVRFVYIFKVQDDKEALFYSESGFSKEYDFSIAFYDCFQMPYINPIDVHRVVDWADDAVFYQIFVDRFYRGDIDKDDSYINMAWTDKPLPTSFAGGDLDGIRQKLSYLKSLGVNTIYLTPIFKSISNHKYDINDYYEIDRQFGTKISSKALVDELHALGMRIVMDAVFNHSSDLWEPFQDVLKNGGASTYFDWFMIDGDQPSIEKRNYETFATVAYMPKLNTSNLDVQNYLLEVTSYWTQEFKLDGWRLDVSDEVSHDFWRRFRKTVKSINPNLIIIGENWHDAYPYLQGDQYDGIMNYAFTKACLDYFATESLSSVGMAERLNHILMRNTDAVNRMNLNLLDSHDTHRFLTQVKGSKDKLLAATALLFTFVGIPCLYYGTELGMEGGYDPDCRRGFDWNKEHWDIELLEKMKSIIKLKQEPVTQKGSINISATDDLLSLKRTFGQLTLELLINNGKRGCVHADNVVIQNGFSNSVLKANGFLIHISAL
ncbi:alpha-glycosidase [Streptococcus sp. X16XC17]|uniref:glycoside hydrolase family 13 protein n=1 Tax=unclassified Streptococcus TaxID=2608887 RepID=UPI00066FC00D|nr:MULTISPECIES: glycoside hydrolase family 13 protein [unclassified Streptococcus]TCD45437.1 alpha-glycosidase [Streptococcus sp. X16XC17]